MTLLRLACDDGLFSVRVAVACLNAGHVFLQRSLDSDFWLLPGGHGELGESSAAAARREAFEELGVEVQIEPLLWVVENFFRYEELDCHQLSFVYLATLPPGCRLLEVTRDYEGVDSGHPFVGRWFPIASLGEIQMYPTFLKDGLRALPDALAHVVHVDEHP